MTMNMKQWVADILASDKKKSLPVLSFPSIQKMGITVAELINSSDKQAEGMKIIADSCPTAASVSLMDLSLEAEAFGSTIRVSDDEVPTVIGSIVSTEEEAEALKVPEIGAGRTQIYIDAIEKVKGDSSAETEGAVDLIEQRKKATAIPIITGVASALLLFAIVFGVFLFFRNLPTQNENEEIFLPDFTGQMLPDVQEQYRDSFNFIIKYDVYENAEIDQIMKQEPTGNVKKVKKLVDKV